MRIIAAVSLSLLTCAFASPISNGTRTRSEYICHAELTLTDAPAEIVERGTPTVHKASVTRQTISLCTQYAYYSANGYEILNNLWGKDSATSGDQCTYYEGATGSGASAGVKWSSTWQWTGAENNVKSYVYVGRILTKGITVDKAKTMLTEVQWSYNTTSNVRANVAYDVFTAADPNHVNSSGDYELMIWLGRMGGVWPISEKGAPIATVTIAGYNFELYFGYNGSMKVYSFVRAGNDITNFKADVKLFFDHLTKNYQYPETTQNLIVYQIGTEAFTGGPVKFTVPNFSAAYTT